MMQNNENFLILVHGVTGSGKSEVCNYLESEYGIINFHPFGFVKRQLEEHYELPYGALDTRAGKDHKADGANSTMQEIMIDLYHFYRKHDQRYCTRNLRREVPRLLEKHHVIMQGIRNPEEVGAIRYIKESLGVPFLYLDIKRDKEERATSDEHYEYVQDESLSLCSVSAQIENNGTLKDLHIFLDAICSMIGINKKEIEYDEK